MSLVSEGVGSAVEAMFGVGGLAVGCTVRHPDGRVVIITYGEAFGTYGLADLWYWREVLPDGSLAHEEEGRGWTSWDVQGPLHVAAPHGSC